MNVISVLCSCSAWPDDTWKPYSVITHPRGVRADLCTKMCLRGRGGLLLLFCSCLQFPHKGLHCKHVLGTCAANVHSECAPQTCTAVQITSILAWRTLALCSEAYTGDARRRCDQWGDSIWPLDSRDFSNSWKLRNNPQVIPKCPRRRRRRRRLILKGRIFLKFTCIV